MLIYAVADIHARPERLAMMREVVLSRRPDVVVVAGDITRYRNPVPVFSFLNDLPAPVLAVRGNTDLPWTERIMARSRNLDSLHLERKRMNGVDFVGVGGTIPVPFSTRMGLFESPLVRRLEPLIHDRTVLVAHPPPWGVLDEAFERRHAGCRRLKRLVLSRGPRVLICGHIHERAGAARLGRTLVVNCSIGRAGAGALIDLAGGFAPSVRFL